MENDLKTKIPKIIHYIWLGNNPLPKITQRCIESWKKFCPDYEIKKWDESNLNIDINKYCRQAYDANKYAFASDVLRFYVLKQEGGIYLDVDVELLKPLDDYLHHSCFTGFERSNSINPGLIMGCEKNHKDVSELFDMYNNETFINNDGTYCLKTICDRTYEYFSKFGLKCDNSIENVSQTVIYPTEYFNPTDLDTQKVSITNNTVSIHHYCASWYTKKMKFKRGLKTFLNFITFGLFGKIFLRKNKR